MSPVEAGIYIHIPFCVKKCIYCDFYSLPYHESEIDQFTKTLVKEIESADQTETGDWRFSTIFLGGGTPSLLEPRYLDLIINSLHRTFRLSGVTEITMEVNPGEAPFHRLKTYRKLGINRLSIGFQSFQPNLLNFLSRIHSDDDCFITYSDAEKAGFDNINIDMIFNIPGQTVDIWKTDLKTAIRLNPKHISAYSLTVEKGTPLYHLTAGKMVVMPDEGTDIRMFRDTRDILLNAGYTAYEISNFARPGYECRHNLGYWKLHPYLGFGPSAHSYDLKRRWWNISSLDAYIRTIGNVQSPEAGSEVITDNNRFNELVFNGLRMKQGVFIPQLTEFFSGDLDIYLAEYTLKWKELIIENDHLLLTEEGKLLTDEISSDLFIIDD